MMTIPTAKLIKAMTTIQSNFSANQSSPSAIDMADRAQKRLFVISIIFGVLAALIAALLAWLLWRANNKYQDTVKADADARIAEAQQKAATALKDAGTANETALRLEGDNLTLRGQVATLETQAADAKKDVAGLQIAALDAKAAQQRVETDLAKQQERAAIAEKSLLELQERLRHRHLTGEQRSAIIESSKTVPKGEVIVYAFIGDDEAITFSVELVEALVAAGWNAKHAGQHVSLFTSGLGILVRKLETAHAGSLQKVLKDAHLEAKGIVTDQVQEGVVALFVGPKL
jgi:hypothetical protein